MLAAKINTNLCECGTDEAGRGCLAGPVTAAAVILPDGFSHPLLNDSKKLSAKNRFSLKSEIEKHALTYSVAHVMMDEIDSLNILHASLLAMRRAITSLSIAPEFIAVDGNRFTPFDNIPFECIVKGDGKYQHIAAASILAKTARDAFMARIAQQYPHYGWEKNKGYPTKIHRDAIQKYGVTPYHRKSFKLLPKQLLLPLNT